MPTFDDAYLRMQQFSMALLSRLSHSKKEIDEIRAGQIPLDSNCPSRASAIDTLLLRRMGKDLDEVNAAFKQMRDELWEECGKTR